MDNWLIYKILMAKTSLPNEIYPQESPLSRPEPPITLADANYYYLVLDI